MSITNKLYRAGFVFISLAVVWLASVNITQAASLSMSPSSGTFSVDSTFDVSLFLDTQGKEINALKIFVKFPSDKLQLVSPMTGNSIVTLWTTQPQFNNHAGTIELQGGIPSGINTSNGLVTTLTFRVSAVGNAAVKFLDDSKTLLNDGEGTDVLSQSNNGVFELSLPPPNGPVVVSETHPDPSRWHTQSNVVLGWTADESEVEGYSYIFNGDPVDIPDDISEGIKEKVIYKNLSDGKHYFHIKSLRDEVWGGISHFAVKVDATPPAEFPIDILPSKKTSEKQPVIKFVTSDNLSGIDHYELKFIPLQHKTVALARDNNQPFFIEVSSPFVTPELELGEYDIIIRAYDKAGKFREKVERLGIVRPLLQITGGGVIIKESVVISWIWLSMAGVILAVVLIYIAWRLRKWHRQLDRLNSHKSVKKMPVHVKEQLEELKKFRKKYGKAIVLLLFLGSSLFFKHPSLARQTELDPPLITTISENISNKDIFYIAGKTDVADIKVVIYLQNLRSGETLSYSVNSDKRGDWFYRHDAFLSSGEYLLWVQSKIGEQMSPPCPQAEMAVRATAIQFGGSRISLETLYAGIMIIALAIVFGLIAYIIYHGYHIRKKSRQFIKEVEEVKEAVRRGFAVLSRDIETELAVVKKVKLSRALSAEEKILEKRLLKDMKRVERRIGKEILDVEKLE